MHQSRFLVAGLTFACAIVSFGSKAASAQAAPSPAPSQNPCQTILDFINRPTIASSPCTVPTGHVLVESGYANVVSTGSASSVAPNYPQSVVRIGTFDKNVEFDVFPPNYTRSSAGGGVTTGWGDFAIGTQFTIAHNDKAIWGGEAIVTIPTGNPAFTAGAAQYTANFNWVYNLSPALGLFGTESINALSTRGASGSAQSYFAFTPSTGVSAQWSSRSVLYGEYTYFSQEGPAQGSKGLFDFGYEQALGAHLEVDVEYGFSPPDAAGLKQHYFGAGLSLMN